MQAVASGTTAALVIGTETNLEAARTAALASYVYGIDTNALVAPEVLILRVYAILLASGGERLVYAGSVVKGVDEDPIQYSVPIPMDAGTGITIRATLQQKNGTGRTFPWKLYSL